MPTSQRVKEFLRHLVEKEEVKNNRPGILGPMAAMARKVSLSDADKDFLGIPTYSMSKATLVDYMFHAVKLLELYQMMFDYLASAGETEDVEAGTAGNGPEASLMAMLRHHKKTDLPN